MKKTLSIVLTSLLLASFVSILAFAGNKLPTKFINENEFTVASYNGTTNLRANSYQDLEDATYWLLENKNELNLKYVSYLGKLTGGSKYTYYNTVAKGLTTLDEFLALFSEEKEWEKEFKKLGDIAELFKEENVPMTFSASMADYYGGGYNRNTYFPEYIAGETTVTEEAAFNSFDEYNSYTIVENNGVKYMMFQLEVYPRENTLVWFNSVMAENPDKYAIIFTNSMIDDGGKMYTLWDFDKGTSGVQTNGTSQCDNINFFWNGNPTDGETTWNKAFNKHSNILAVITSYVSINDIITRKETASNGNQVAIIAANVSNGVDAKNGPTYLLTKFSPDNKTITCSYAVAFGDIIESSTKVITLDTIGTLAEPLTDDTLPQIKPQYNGANKAYIFGYEGNLFKPNNNMTRAEACTIFARLILGVQDIPSGYTTRFTDVKEGAWYYNAIAYLDETGYFFRNKNTEYKPNEPITRAEFVDLANSTSTLVAKNASPTFVDVPEDHFYYSSIMSAASSGLVNGYEDNTFRPDKTITRAEVVTVINRLLGLKTNNSTVSPSSLENEFNDIGNHWAKLNILMASNSNVKSNSHTNATLNGVSENANSIIFENKHFQITVAKKNGKVTKILNLYNNEDINANSGAPYFINITNSFETKLNPTKLELEGNRIKVTFKGGTVVYFIAEIKDNYMAFEIDSELPRSIRSVTFANLVTNVGASTDPESFKINCIGMTAWTNPVNKGYYETSSDTTIAHAYSIYDSGTMGAKIGIVFSMHKDHIKLLQELTDAIDGSVGLKNLSGGAYAQEWEKNYGDYIITSSVNPEKLDDNLALAKKFDIDQYDLHQGSGTFRQGDFWFHYTESGTAKEYYEKIGTKIKEAGIQTGLHTYAYYVDYNASGITADPKWQAQLETLETYTLRSKLSKFNRNIKTEEDATNFDTRYAFFYRNSPYVRIDNEIIYVGSGTVSGFINVQRAQCGTKAEEHEKGATIYHLGGYFNMFCPVLGSELFYHIADLTAQAYNDGQFEMIYLDAIDGLGNHLKEGEETWYYFHMFVQRILSQCKRTPIVETSSTAPSEWNFRGRIGAWDYATHSYKQHIANHVSTNKGTIANNMTTTLGWFSFFPDKSPAGNMKNTIQKTMFRDDLDFLGMNAILYNMSIVIEGFSTDALLSNPYHYDNVEYYTNLYTKLRKSHYFTDDVINKVKSIGGEWKVVEKSNGVYAFQQMYYNKQNLTVTSEYSDNVLNGFNPFTKKSPFIRIESRYSTLFEDPITVVNFGENEKLKANATTKTCALDLTEHMALTVKVKGTATEGDALVIGIKGSSSSGVDNGRTDHFIDLNFEGWKEFILIDADNAEYDIQKYVFDGIETRWATYPTYRNIPPYKNITSVTAYVNTASAKNAQIGEVIAYKTTEAPVKNPTVAIGNSKITFNCEISGGEYIEYDPATNKAILYHNAEQTKEEVSFSGMLEVNSGSFSAVYTAEALTDAPVRARLVLGFAGQQIAN